MSNKIEATGRFYVHAHNTTSFSVISPTGRYCGVFTHSLEEAVKKSEELNASLDKMPTKRLILRNCLDCPSCFSRRTRGAGCADDYLCSASNKVIAGYCESHGDLPQDGEFPTWCPLKDETKPNHKFIAEGI